MFKKIFYRIGFLYLLLALFFSWVVDWKKLQVKLLNEFKIPIDYLVFFSHGRASYEEKRFRDQVLYYEKLKVFISNHSEVLGILGFCYYYLGEHDRAIHNFQKAENINSNLFWHSYNLGVIYFQARQFQTAGRYFTDCLAKSLPFALQVFRHSVIYRNFDNPIEDTDGFKPDLQSLDIGNFVESSLAAAYVNAFRLLILCYDYSGDYSAVVRTAQMAIEKNVPEPSFFYYFLGSGALCLDQLTPAVAAIQKSIQLNPQNRKAYQLLNLCYERGKESQPLPEILQKVRVLNMNMALDDVAFRIDRSLKIY